MEYLELWATVKFDEERFSKYDIDDDLDEELIDAIIASCLDIQVGTKRDE